MELVRTPLDHQISRQLAQPLIEQDIVAAVNKIYFNGNMSPTKKKKFAETLESQFVDSLFDVLILDKNTMEAAKKNLPIGLFSCLTFLRKQHYLYISSQSKTAASTDWDVGGIYYSDDNEIFEHLSSEYKAKVDTEDGETVKVVDIVKIW